MNPADKDDRHVIPANALFAVCDTQHLELKKWKEDQVKAVRKTTFSNAERFPDYKLNYSQDAAAVSLLDCDKAMRENKPNPAHGWATSTNREWLFLNKDEVAYVESRQKEKELLLQNLSLACERAEDENQRMIQAKYGNNPPKMQWEVKFKPREH